MTDLLQLAIVNAQALAPEDQDRIASAILHGYALPVIEA